MKKLLLLLTASLAILSCKRDELDHSCETFFATPAEIVITDRYTDIGWQDYEIDTICAGETFSLPTYLTRRQYDEYRWIVNNDSAYTYKTNRFSLGFPVGKYIITCIGKKYLNNSACKGSVHIDTMKKAVMSIEKFSYLDGVSEGTSTEQPNVKYKFYAKNAYDSLNRRIGYLYFNFGNHDNGIGKITFGDKITAKGVSYVEGAGIYIRTYPKHDTEIIARYNRYYNTKTRLVKFVYTYDSTYTVEGKNKYTTSKEFVFTGVKNNN